jgi:hypothetical protein
VRRVLAALVLCSFAAATAAQVLYKWTDSSGKVVYSDRPPPKGFQGTVSRIESDPMPPPVVVEPREAAPAAKPATTPDLATRRRETRERLQAQVDAARARVEVARKALEDAQSPGEDDRRVIQRRIDPSTSTVANRVPGVVDPDVNAVMGGAPTGPSPKGACRSYKGQDGKEYNICAKSILSPEYHERVEKLEEALRLAEQQLDAAQEAYRRGVD